MPDWVPLTRTREELAKEVRASELAGNRLAPNE